MNFCAYSTDSEIRKDTERLLYFMGEHIVDVLEADAILCLDEESKGSIPDAFTGTVVNCYVDSDEAIEHAFGAGWTPKSLRSAIDRCYQLSKVCVTTDRNNSYASLIGTGKLLQQVKRLLVSLQKSQSPVLISGQSGTGKDLVGRLVHQNSLRRNNPFVPLNCSTIPKELQESEIFGHEVGAFTGAVSKKVGRMELANGGTLFLNEVGSLPLSLQSRLLRVMEEGEFVRLGGTDPIKVDVRILCSTQRNLDALVDSGEFRVDLLSRIDVISINLPNLSDCSEDIPELLSHFAKKISVEQGREIKVTQDVIAILKQYTWPANIRELKNLMERLSIEFPDELISTENLPAKYTRIDIAHRNMQENGIGSDAQLPLNGLDLKNHLANLEITLIQQALNDSNDVVARAADLLHIRRTTLVEKMKKYGIERG